VQSSEARTQPEVSRPATAAAKQSARPRRPGCVRLSCSTGCRPLAWIRRSKSPQPAVFFARRRIAVEQPCHPRTTECPYSVVDPGYGSLRASLDRAARIHSSSLRPCLNGQPHATFNLDDAGSDSRFWRFDAGHRRGHCSRASERTPVEGSNTKYSCKDSGIAAGGPQPAHLWGHPYVRQRTDKVAGNAGRRAVGLDASQQQALRLPDRPASRASASSARPVPVRPESSRAMRAR